MTRIEAILPPSRLDDLRAALAGHPWISGLTVLEVKESRGGPAGALFRGAGYSVAFTPLVKVELVVPSPLVPRILDDLARWARAAGLESGTLTAGPIEEAVRVRTGERGEGAL